MRKAIKEETRKEIEKDNEGLLDTTPSFSEFCIVRGQAELRDCAGRRCQLVELWLY